MANLIDRQELLKRTVYNPLHPPYITEKDVNDIPSAQWKGKWIKEHEEWFTDYPYKCTNCGKYSRARYHFCPNCGADMRGEQDEYNN